MVLQDQKTENAHALASRVDREDGVHVIALVQGTGMDINRHLSVFILVIHNWLILCSGLVIKIGRDQGRRVSVAAATGRDQGIVGLQKTLPTTRSSGSQNSTRKFM